MIDLKELRIGNWIQPNYEKFTDEYNSKPDRYGIEFPSDNYGEDQYDFIPITEKLLQNFGFKKNQWFYEMENYEDLWIKPYPKKFEIGIGEVDIRNSEIIYLHDLQNIFYSLFQVELNDIVAYNYYLSFNFAAPHSFEEFLIEKEKVDLGDGFDYYLGDLPPNLFEI